MTLVNKSEKVSPSVSVMRIAVGSFTMFISGRANELDIEPYLHSTARAGVPEQFFSDVKHT
jgi:hypothetical protein